MCLDLNAKLNDTRLSKLFHRVEGSSGLVASQSTGLQTLLRYTRGGAG